MQRVALNVLLCLEISFVQLTSSLFGFRGGFESQMNKAETSRGNLEAFIQLLEGTNLHPVSNVFNQPLNLCLSHLALPKQTSCMYTKVTAVGPEHSLVEHQHFYTISHSLQTISQIRPEL